jgi:hypothetical protein
VTLQGLAAAVLAAEGIGEHRVGRAVDGRVLALVAMLIFGEERPAETVGPAEGSRGRGIDGRSRHRARCQTVVITGLVLIAHPLVTLH